ncbi:MAG: SDR family NAD(P)-dependent oxidoreductase [Pseudomonadota bacterium]
MSRHGIVVGAHSGIGSAVLKRWCESPALTPAFAKVHAVSRQPLGINAAPLENHICNHSEEAITAVVETITDQLRECEGSLDRILIALGTLHGDGYQPEKSLRSLESAAMQEVYRVNTVLPMLWLSRLFPLLRRQEDCRIAVISARVGSLEDNRLGGWWSYRASKAALNMALKCTAIEFGRMAPGVKLVAFHPGTVDTPLSQPFQRNVKSDKLFEPSFVADRLDGVLDSLAPDGQLSYLDWDGKPIPW